MHNPCTNKATLNSKKVCVEKKSLCIACLLLLISLFSIDLYNPALPSMARYLDSTQIAIRAILVVYFAGLCLSQIIYGVICDWLSMKTIIIIALALTVLGNYVTIYAETVSQIYIFRFLTAMGTGGCLIASKVIIKNSYKKEKSLINAFAIYVMSAQISPLISPFIGGVLVQHISWQSNFIFLSIIAAIMTIFVLFLYEKDNKNSNKSHLNHIIQDYKHVITNPLFVLFGIMSGLIYSLTLTYYTINPFILQKHGISPSINGLYYALYSFGLLAGTYITKHLSRKKISSIKLLMMVSIGLSTVSVLFYIASSFFDRLYVVIIFSVLTSILSGMSIPILMSLNMLASNKKSSIVSSLQGSIKIFFVVVVLLILLTISIKTIKSLALLFLLISVMTMPIMYLIYKMNTHQLIFRRSI